MDPLWFTRYATAACDTHRDLISECSLLCCLYHHTLVGCVGSFRHHHHFYILICGHRLTLALSNDFSPPSISLRYERASVLVESACLGGSLVPTAVPSAVVCFSTALLQPHRAPTTRNDAALYSNWPSEASEMLFGSCIGNLWGRRWHFYQLQVKSLRSLSRLAAREFAACAKS